MNQDELFQHITTRTQCPVCGSKNLSDPRPKHDALPYPFLPICTDELQETDLTAPFTIVFCEDCGLILLREVVDPQILYEIFHSDGIGRLWDEHYEMLAQLVRTHHKSGRVLEIGAGQGKLIKKLLNHYGAGVEVIDPMYEGPREGITVHDSLLTQKIAQKLKGQFDAVVSSHTLEHFLEYNSYFENVWTCLKPGGLLFTSVPNMEAGFSKGYGNQLNFEHPAICINTHWLFLHMKNGFEIVEMKFFRDHSFMMVARKVEKKPAYLSAFQYTSHVLDLYEESINKRITQVRELATSDKENWVFGASNFTQPLFMYGLEESNFVGVMDNSPLKHDKRLYGTGLTCKKPEDVVGKRKNLRVFLNLGQYNTEIKEQLTSLDPTVECIFL